MRTEVCLTIDTEFSIAGAFSRPERYSPIAEPAVCCEVDGKEQGLAFILDALAEFGCTATFFVEALNAIYFGDKPMGQIAQRILSAGHDVQLHLHPMWRHFRSADWRSRGGSNPDDSCSGRSRQSLCEIISEGISTFARWGIPRPTVVRAGNLEADLEFYAALETFDIRFTSNIGLAIFRPKERELQLTAGRHWINRILEIPVLTYEDPRLGAPHHQRCLTIAATSWSETKHLLLQARSVGLSPVVVLSHPFEFVKQRGYRFNHLYRNRVTQDRLRSLLRFISEHDQDFESINFRDRAQTWLTSGETGNPILRVPPSVVLARMVENGTNELFMRY